MLAALAFGAVAAAAPSPRSTGTPILRIWHAEDYRASPVNWRVLPDPRTGMVYVSNNFGVLEFDGATVRLIAMPRGGAARALVLDSAGQIWVGGVGELARLTPDASGRMAPEDFTDRIAAGATGTALPAADEPEREGGGRGPAPLSGLGNLNRAVAGRDAVYFRLPDTVARLAPDGSARLIPAAARLGQLLWLDGALHANERDRGFLRFAPEGLVAVPGAGRLDTYAAREERTGGWRLLTTRGPAHWPGPGHAPVALAPETEAFFDDEEPTCATFLADGRAAYGTTRSGLLLFNAEGKFERRLDRSHGLPANRINGLAQDREGGLWLALHAGLVRIELDSPYALHGPALGLTGGPRHLLRAGERLYVTHGEGLAWRDDADGLFRSVPEFRTGSHRLAAGRHGVLATAQGFHELSGAQPKVFHLPGPYLYGILPLRPPSDRVVAASATAVHAFRPAADGTWRRELTFRHLPAGADDLLESPSGDVWLVTRTAEIWRLKLGDGVVADAPARVYGADRGLPPLLRRDQPRLLLLGDDLVVAGARGLFRFDPAADRFVPETRFPALADPATGRGPAMAVAAADGGAWFYFDGATPRLARLRRDAARAWQVQIFPAPALRELVVNHLCDDPGLRTVWIAAQGQLLSMDPAWQRSQEQPALRALVRAVTAGGSPVALAALAELPAAATSLRFEYAAPAFGSDHTGRSGLEFRTRLAGFAPGWSEWSDAPYRDFTNLPPGRFDFEVQARDFSGRESAVTRLGFVLPPPWWRTPWAYAGAAGLAAAAVAGFVRLRTRVHRRRAEHLEAIVAERTRELERLRRLELDEKIAAQLAEERARLEMLRYQLNPHFLFNALNSLYGLVYPHSRPAGDLVRQLAEFCRTTFTRAADQWQSVAEEVAMLRAYLAIEQARWRERLAVTVEADPAADPARLPAFLLLPLVENAIKHGGATSPALLSVRLTTRREPDGDVTVEVANSGTWLAAHDPRPTESTGIGMENLRARLVRCFPGRHRLEVAAADGWVVVRLRLGAGGQN